MGSCVTLEHYFVGESLYVVGLETSHYKNMGLADGSGLWVLFFLVEGPLVQTEPMHVVLDLFGFFFSF